MLPWQNGQKYEMVNSSPDLRNQTLSMELRVIDKPDLNRENFDRPLKEPDVTVTKLRLKVRNWIQRLVLDHSGWRTGALIAAIMALVSLLINLGFAIVLVAKGLAVEGLATLYEGSCQSVRDRNLWSHIAINILSTILLSGSNYCMQCLGAPTRKEVDHAHQKGVWLDIGAPSIRNLRHIATYKVVLWWMLGLSSIPLHMMYEFAVLQLCFALSDNIQVQFDLLHDSIK